MGTGMKMQMKTRMSAGINRLVMIASLLGLQPGMVIADEWRSMRMDLLDEVNRQMRAVTGESLPATVEQALQRVERHRFVPPAMRGQAYQNQPLPIGRDQTISQPFIVALMTTLLEPGPFDTVLEVGTGSGYQAAVLAEIVGAVYTVEIIESLADEAQARLRSLGYENVHVRHGDGTLGWASAGPFDGIIVTAAGVDIPASLLEQLDTGGRLVMPVGGVHEVQQLKVIERTAHGFEERDVIPVRFVPITHEVRD